MASFICLQYNVRGRYSSGYQQQGSCVCVELCQRKILLSKLMPSVVCVHFGQLANHYVTEACTSYHHRSYLCQDMNAKCYEATIMLKLFIISVT